MQGRWLRALVAALPLVAFVAAAGCGPTLVDLQQTLQVTDVTTGWNEGERDGRTRLVPTVAFRLRKQAADTPLDRVSLNIVFRYRDTGDHLDDIFLQRVEIGPEGAEPLTVRADTGYSGEPPQTGADMLQNSYFRDIDVRILARQTSGSWVELHAGPVERRILSR